MAAKAWFEVRPGRATMIQFSNGDAKVLKAGSVFQESKRNPHVLRLLRGKHPRIRELGAEEAAAYGDDILVVLPDSVS